MAQSTTTILGHLTHEPKLTLFERSGNEKLVMRVASSRRVLRDGEWKDGDLLFLNVEAWNQLARNSMISLSKGMPVIASGSLCSRDYTDKDGKPRTEVFLKASHIAVDLNRHVVGIRRAGMEKTIDGVMVPGGPEFPPEKYSLIVADQSSDDLNAPTAGAEGAEGAGESIPPVTHPMDEAPASQCRGAQDSAVA